MRDLLVIGSLNMDMVVRTPHIPRPGETLMGHFSGYVPGGKGANQAYAAGRLGGCIAMLGKVGQDEFGDALLNSLRGAGVDTSLIFKCAERTGQALICVGEDGGNSIVVLPGANACCDAEFICAHAADIADSRAIMLQMEIPHGAVYEAIRQAKKAGRMVFLNPAPAPDDIPDEIFPLIDYITPNETELEALTGVPAPDLEGAKKAAQALLKRGVAHVLATLGSKGALHVDSSGAVLYPGRRVSPVDTTAAGDTFNAAFAVRLMEGAPLAQAAAFANAAAAISVTRAGAQPSIPSREETDNLFKEDVNCDHA